MDAAFIDWLSAIDTFICVTARIDWSFSVFWITAPVAARMSAALGTITLPAPFCTINVRRLPALGTLITGPPVVTPEPFTNTVGATGPVAAAFEELAVDCEPAAVFTGAPALFGAAFNVVFKPGVCVGGAGPCNVLTTGAVAATGAVLCAGTVLGPAAVDGLAPVAVEEDSGVTGAP